MSISSPLFCHPLAGMPLLLTLGLLVTLSPSQEASAAPPRQSIELSEGWRFARGPQASAERVEFDDSGWQDVRIPHDWSIQGPFEKSNPAGGDGAFLPTGVGWYRLTLPANLVAEGRKVLVEFDGVMANSDVWLNGHHLGHRPNGYVSFRYDLTEHLNSDPAATNTLSVQTDTHQQVASRWYTGSGIYRKARLLVFDKVHLSDLDTFVTTPEVSAAKANVHINAVVVNDSQQAQQCKLHTTVLDPSGAEVASDEQQLEVAAGASRAVQSVLSVANPQRWNVGEGNMYVAVQRLTVGDTVRDQTETRFGIRDVQFKSDTGFWINGQNIKLKGVCLHHDGGAFGAAVPTSIWRDRLKRLQSLGVNAIRTAHNPPSPELLDLCDELGILVMDEFFDCWTVGKRKYDYHLYFEKWARRDLADTIRRDRNHPCVVLYSVGNEIRDTHRAEHAKQVLAGLVEACHNTDPTRCVTQGLFRPNTTHDYDNGLADLLDVIGTNYRDAELLQAWRDQPGRRIVGTEQSHERSTWLACRDNPQHSGQFLWVGVDYLGESRRWPVTTFDSGLIDRTARPHPRGYERQSWWSEEPMVRAFRRTSPTEATPADPGYEVAEWVRKEVLFDDWTPSYKNRAPNEEMVEVYSNCEQVRLELNGRDLGTKSLPPDARPRTWQVNYEPGELVAIGLNDGQEVARHRLRTAGEPVTLKLTSNQQELSPDWDEIATIQVDVVDAKGELCPTANYDIEFRVEGPGELVAVDNASIVSLESFHEPRRQTIGGQCIAYVRATGSEGEITLVAECDGLGENPATAKTNLRASP